MHKMNIILGILSALIAAFLFYEGVAVRTGISHRYIVDDKLFNGKAYLREFIQPTQPEIQSIAKGLKRATPEDTVIATYNWLEDNYHYATDNIKVYNGKKLAFIGNDDTWNLPTLTLAEKKQGTMYIDCEDGTFLLTSLLRANGINAWANIGTVKIEEKIYGHAWVTVYLNGERYLLETTLGEPLKTFQPVPDIYSAEFTFNESVVRAKIGADVNKKIDPLPPAKIPELRKILEKQ